MLQALDKYKFGLLAVVMTYMFIFMYSNATTFEYIIPAEPFLDDSRIENKEEVLEITPDEVEVPDDFNFSSDAKNIAQSVNDDRESSMTDYGPPKSSNEIAQDIKNLEAQMKKEAGGSAEREKLQRLIDQRKQEQEQAKQQETNTTPTSKGSDKKYGGNVMVHWELDDRKAHNNNRDAVRNPGYTCDERANGIVYIDVRTNHNGDVISAKYNATRSTGATQCMIEQAIKYAKLSRFEYSKKSNQQTGWIKYTFVYK